MLKLASVLSISNGFRFQFEPAQNCNVLLYPEGMIKLNGSAGEIMAMVDGKSSVSGIISALYDKFPQAEGLDQDVILFLEDALEKRWVTIV